MRDKEFVKVDSLYVSKYPVTNKWFEEFIKDGGYSNPEFWSPEGDRFRKHLKQIDHKTPRFWYDEKLNGSESSVVGVSWYEADAFCKYLTKTTGVNHRLPTKEELLDIALGKERKRKFPWGNEYSKGRCNDISTGNRKPLPIGSFPQGATPEGVQDLCGNVWEWTKTNYETGNSQKDFLYMHKTKIERPTLMGNSFENEGFSKDGLRIDPGFRELDIGFRVIKE